jgi:putative flippase GtrA
MKRTVVLIGTIGVLVALVLATLSVYFYGPSTSAPVLVFIAATVGSFLTWVTTTFKDEPHKPTESDVSASKPRRRRVLLSVLFLVAGIALGLLLAKILASVNSPKPWARIETAKEVGEYDRVRLIWREIPKGDEVWILVFDPSTGCYNSGHCYFPQEHFELGLARGDEIVDVLVGREDQHGNAFELIPALVEPAAQKALREGVFTGMPDIPAGVVMFAPSPVRRKAN